MFSIHLCSVGLTVVTAILVTKIFFYIMQLLICSVSTSTSLKKIKLLIVQSSQWAGCILRPIEIFYWEFFLNNWRKSSFDFINFHLITPHAITRKKANVISVSYLKKKTKLLASTQFQAFYSAFTRDMRTEIIPRLLSRISQINKFWTLKFLQILVASDIKKIFSSQLH